MDMIKIFGISSLEDAICISDEKKMCVSCNSNQEVISYELSMLISFDLNGTAELNLRDLPETINLKNKCYKLLGVTEFVPAKLPANLGHYRGHGFINNRMNCYDDMMQKNYYSKEEPINIHTLSYGISNFNFENRQS